MPNNIFQNTASIIPDSEAYLKRPHIHDLLEKSLEKQVTTIVAGAGYGKTQAVYAFLQEYDAVTIWQQLSTFDNLPIRLWENFVYAVSLQNEELASNFALLGLPESTAAYQRFLTLFSNEIKKGKKYVLVYDDVHLIYEKAVFDVFERFISTRIPNFSIIFISRSEPEFNTIGLLSQGLLSTITEDDLRFSENEMIQYFQTQDIQLSSKAVSDIYKYTDGWIFAIHLVRLSLKNRLKHENYALSAAKENIFKLLESEIFSFVSEEMKDFLITLSLIDHIPLELLKELFPNHDALITAMTKISSFVRYDAFLNTYRIHHLFLSFLTEKQDRIKESEKRKIYLKAAKWYAENGNKTNALVYYEKAQDYDSFHNVAVSFSALFTQVTADFLIQIMSGIPEAVLEEHSHLVLLDARLMLSKGKFEEATAKLQTLIQKYEALPESEERNSILGDTHITLGVIGRLSYAYNRNKFAWHYKRASEYMPSGSKLVTKNMSLNVGPYSCQVSSPEEGEVDRYLEEAAHSYPYSKKISNGCGEGLLDLSMAEYAFFQRDLNNAKKYAHLAIAKAQEWDQYHIENAAWFYMLRVRMSSGSYQKVQQTLDAFHRRVQEQNKADGYALFDVASGWLFSMMDQEENIPFWIKDNLETSRAASLNLFDLDVLSRARYYISVKDYTELLTLLNRYENSVLTRLLFGRIEMTLLRAVALYHTNEQDESIKTLELAYQLSHPNHLEMPFVEHGNHMRTLTKSAIRSEGCNIPKQWLESIHTKSSTYAKKLSHIITEYRISNHLENDIRSNFSKREIDLLTDLSHGLTREEIAVNQDLSANTVKSMFQNIYAKLGAINTSDAIRIATLVKLVK